MAEASTSPRAATPRSQCSSGSRTASSPTKGASPATPPPAPSTAGPARSFRQHSRARSIPGSPTRNRRSLRSPRMASPSTPSRTPSYAVVRFTRDPATSILTFEDCITGEDASGPGPVGTDACSEIPTSRTGGEDSGLDAPRWAELGRGGRSLYVAADRDDAAIARFDRNLNTGELTYRDYITGEECGRTRGLGCCRALPVHAPLGVNSGLDRRSS